MENFEQIINSKFANATTVHDHINSIVLGETRAPTSNMRLALLPYAIEKNLRMDILNLSLRNATSADMENPHSNPRSTLMQAERYLNNPHPVVFIICIKRGIKPVLDYIATKGWQEEKRYSMLMQMSTAHKIRVFSTYRNMLIITSEMSDIWQTRLIGALPKFFTQIQTSEIVLEYAKALTANDNAKAESLLVKIIDEKLDTKEIELQAMSRIFKTLTSKKQLMLRDRVDTARQILSTLEDQIATAVKQVQIASAEYTFYTAETDPAELARYIQNNRYIVDYTSQNQHLTVAIEAPLDYYDIAGIKQMIKNPNAFIYPHYIDRHRFVIPDYLRQNTELFLQFFIDVFINQKYKIYSRAEYTINFETLTVKRAPSAEVPLTWNLDSRLKNPEKSIAPHMHVMQYNCWSGNKANADKALATNDFIGALEILVATTKDINVLDSIVFGNFISSQFVQAPGDASLERPYNPATDPSPKTVYDEEKKKFRTFYDIFRNDYLEKSILQENLKEDFSDIT